MTTRKPIFPNEPQLKANPGTTTDRWHFSPPSEEELLEQLKNRLLREALADGVGLEIRTPLRRAANEAAALAWLEPHPLLIFPILFEEKAGQAHLHARRQEEVRLRSTHFLSMSA